MELYIPLKVAIRIRGTIYSAPGPNISAFPVSMFTGLWGTTFYPLHFIYYDDKLYLLFFKNKERPVAQAVVVMVITG